MNKYVARYFCWQTLGLIYMIFAGIQNPWLSSAFLLGSLWKTFDRRFDDSMESNKRNELLRARVRRRVRRISKRLSDG